MAWRVVNERDLPVHYMNQYDHGRFVLCDPTIRRRYTSDRSEVTCRACLAAIAAIVERATPDRSRMVKLKRICQSCRHWRGVNSLQGFCYENRRISLRVFTCDKHDY